MLMLKRNAKEDDAERIETRGMRPSYIGLSVASSYSPGLISHPTPSYVPGCGSAKLGGFTARNLGNKPIIGC